MNSKKKLFRRIMSFALSLVLLLGSFGNAGTMVYAEETDTIKVACVGDSLTSGYLSSGGNKSNTAYPAYLQSLLGSGYEVRNFGIPSYTLMKGTDKSYWNTQEFASSKTFAPDIVLIMLGTNDSKAAYWAAEGFGEEKFKEDAVALVNEYKNLSSNPEVIFAVSPACFVEATSENEGKITQVSVEAMKAVQEELIAENNWKYIDMYARTVDKQNLYHSDGVHFSDTGYRYLAACMYEKIIGTNVQEIPTDGLIAHYDFENVDGTTVPNTVDEANYAGTLHGDNVTIKEGTVLGKSMNFVEGTEGYMSIPQIVNTGANSYSISMWYKYDTSFAHSNVNVVLLQQNGNGRSLLFLNTANKYQSYVNATEVVGNTVIDLDEWQHVTYVYDSENQKVKYYVNGVLDCEKAAGSNEVNALTDLFIGRHKNGGSNPMSMRGDVDEILVYDRVITDAQAKAIYDDKADEVFDTVVEPEPEPEPKPEPGTDLTEGLIAYYDFEDAEGTSVPNKAGESYPGTLSGDNVSVAENEMFGKSLHFTAGTTSKMLIENIVNTSTTSYAFSMWYKLADDFMTGRSENIALVQQTDSGKSVLLLKTNNSYDTYVTGENKASTAIIEPDKWQHVTYVYDTENNVVKYYVNGVLDSTHTTNGSEVNALTNLLIGNHKNGNNQMRGDIDEVRIYNQVITDELAKAIYDEKAGSIVFVDLQTLIEEAQALYESGKLEASDEKAAALNEKLTEAKALTAANTAAEIQAMISELTAAMDTYKESMGITLTINTSVEERSIDRSIFGINHRYAFNGYGSFDSTTMTIKEEFKALYEEAGFGSIRYPGGTISNLFNWKTTIGPKEERKDQIHGFYNNSGQGGIAPNFGIGEIADFANEVNSEIVYVYSLGRGNAQDAADLIEYLNAEVGTNPNGGIDWAAVRSENGHPEPYNVRYFEIGNEMQQAYGVSADGTTSQGYWLNSVSAGSEAAYIDGGIASFTKQYAVDEEDWNAVASRSDGSANLVRYMRYANVNPKKYAADGKTIVDDETFVAVEKGSVSVYVGSDTTPWTIVESFADSSASDKHVVIDYSTGAIKFGDGVNGAIPASGQQIYVSYRVDRDGFIDISKAMKETTAAINEANEAAGIDAVHTANVYSSYETSGFVTKMSSRNADEWYDGLTIHPYSGSVSGSGAEGWYDAAMSLISGTVSRVQSLVDMMPEGKVPVISEYGIFRSTDTKVRSQTHALYIAKTIMEYVDQGSPYIQKHCLIDWYSSGADSLGPTQQAVIQAVAQTGANTTTGEGNFAFFATPSARVFQMLNVDGFGDTIVSAEFDNEETLYGTDAYSAMVAKDSDGNIYAAIVNLDRENAKRIAVEITDGTNTLDLTGTNISIQTLDADIDAENTLENPDNVVVEEEEYVSEASNLTITVPAHAFMVVRITEESEEPEPVVLEKITVKAPTKIEYEIGETFAAAGMEVTAHYSDDTTAVVTDYQVSGFDSETAGTKTITVTYQGKTARFAVTVLPAPVVLEKITVTAPTKTEYEIGEAFAAAGMVVTAHYSDGTTAAVTDYQMSGFDSAAAGEKTIVVTYEGKSASFKVTVSEPEPEPVVLEKITVTAPTKIEYEIGEAFAAAGMVVTAHYSDGTTAAVTDYQMSGFDSAAAGEKDITVTYEGKSASFKVTVKAAEVPEVPVVDKTELQAAVDQFDSKKEDQYTEDSWKAYQTAVEKAKTVLNNTEATQKEVTDALTAVNAAKKALKEKPEGPIEIIIPSKPSAPTAPTTPTAPATGDLSVPMFYVTIMAAAVIALVLSKKSKKA